jgi:signal transduction histidine kinase
MRGKKKPGIFALPASRLFQPAHPGNYRERDICLRYLNAGLRFMLNLSHTARLGIVALSVFLGLLLYALLYPADYAGFLLTLPVGLSAWLFRRRGMAICLAILLAFIFPFIAFNNPEASQPQTLIYFLAIGSIALLIEGLLIGSLRELVDLSDEAREQIAVVYEQQQQLNDIKDQFILNVNHELRTPLTAVYGYLELLLEYNEHLDANTRVTFLKNAMYSCEELQLLVSNVLDTIRIGNERENLYLEELAVADVVHEVIEHFDPRRQHEHSIQMNIPPHLVVRANAQYLRQILRNLLSNAAKYSPLETPIIVSASLYGNTVQKNHPSPEICISVRDFGPGIPQEDIPRLFGQFVRLQRDVSGKVRGTGLGLYVSRQLIEAMNGQIWVESTGVNGEGSNFSFTLPCVPRTKINAKTPSGSISANNVPASLLSQSHNTKETTSFDRQ